jgi:hypothetical protein
MFTRRGLALDRIRVIVATRLLVSYRQPAFAGSNLRQYPLALFDITKVLNQSGTVDLGIQIGFQARSMSQCLHHQHVLDPTTTETVFIRGDRNRGYAKLRQLTSKLRAVTFRALIGSVPLLETIGIANQTLNGIRQHLLIFTKIKIHGVLLKFKSQLGDDILLNFVGAAVYKKLP